MQSDKPLNYPCWKFVLKHMSTEKRIEFAKRCPEIRTADKTVPIKLDYVELDENRLAINQTKFTVGVVSHYLGGFRPPVWAITENAKGGFQYDIGRFGDLNNPVVKARMDFDRAPSAEETAQNFEDRRLLKETLAQLNWETVQPERKLLEDSIKVLRTKIEAYNQQLAISELKFDNYIKITITTGKTKTCEYVRYDVPLKESLRYLAEKFFEKRQIISKLSRLRPCPITPKQFTIKSERTRVLVKFEDQKIKTIEIPCCNGEFKNMQGVNATVTGYAVSLRFYIPESELAGTFKLIQNMLGGRPKKVEDLLRERSMHVKVKMNRLKKLWNFTIELSDVKKHGVPGEDYYVQITGVDEVKPTSRVAIPM